MRADSAVEKRQEAAGAEPSALSISPSSQLSGKRLRRAVGASSFRRRARWRSTWHFRYSRSENVFGRREALDLVRRSLKHPTCLLSPARCEGDWSQGRGARADQQSTIQRAGSSPTLGLPTLVTVKP